MVWVETNIENAMEKALVEELNDSTGKALAGAYHVARPKVLNEVAEEIKASEPDLSDHGPRHIQNVLQNVWDLMSHDINAYTAHDLFILVLSTLYHDVGNFYRRERHNKNISRIFNETYPGNAPHFEQTKMLVVSIAGAHTGKCPRGTLNTISSVKNVPFGGKTVKSKEIAAILRLADELAEGPQRTSAVRAAAGGYGSDSAKFHAYARCCKRPAIDSDSGRVALDLHIDVDCANGQITSHGIAFPDFLEFIYSRIMKLDQERKYAKFFCDSLSPFKSTSVHMTFWHASYGQHRDALDIDLEPLVLSDIVVPGGTSQPVDEIEPSYAPDRLADQIKKAVLP